MMKRKENFFQCSLSNFRDVVVWEFGCVSFPVFSLFMELKLCFSLAEETDEKNLRRASYLRATKNEEYVRNVPLDPCVITTSADTDYEMVTSTSKPLLSSSSTTTTKK